MSNNEIKSYFKDINKMDSEETTPNYYNSIITFVLHTYASDKSWLFYHAKQ